MIAWLARKTRAASDVVVAVGAVTRSRRAVASRPVGELVDARATDAMPEVAWSTPRGKLNTEQWMIGARWGAAVDRALRWVPGDAACLVRAGALRELLDRGGLDGAEVRIGVRRGPNGFEAHAWVEVNGTPIAEPAALRGAFSPLDGVTLR